MFVTSFLTKRKRHCVVCKSYIVENDNCRRNSHAKKEIARTIKYFIEIFVEVSERSEVVYLQTFSGGGGAECHNYEIILKHRYYRTLVLLEFYR